MKSKPPRKRKKEVGVNFALLSGRVGVSVPVPIEGGGSACVGSSRSRELAVVGGVVLDVERRNKHSSWIERSGRKRKIQILREREIKRVVVIVEVINRNHGRRSRGGYCSSGKSRRKYWSEILIMVVTQLL